jgi:hypothetical protein
MLDHTRRSDSLGNAGTQDGHTELTSAGDTHRLINAHRQAMEKPISEIARFLQEILSRRLTAYIVGVKEGKTVSRWATGEITEIRDHEVEQRLRAAYEITSLLAMHGNTVTAKAWFIGINPQLNDEAPAEVLRQGRYKEVYGAARAFVVGG